MDFSKFSNIDLIDLYSKTIKELKKRGVLRTNNVIGEIGEYFVYDIYNNSPDLPVLNSVPLGTKNINAISADGDRYSIKSTTGNVTSVFYGLEPKGSGVADKPLFEYVVICKLDDDYTLEGVYQLDWNVFVKHKKWHSRMKAWNLSVTQKLIDDCRIIYYRKANARFNENNINGNTFSNPPVKWNKTQKINHDAVREEVAKRLSKHFLKPFLKQEKSSSRYVTEDNDHALFILSAKFSERNNEYWYSINDEILPWMELYPECHVAFSLGSSKDVLMFTYDELKDMLTGCLKTKEDEKKKKKPHYHISFSVENNGNVYFKKKKPVRDFINVTNKLI